MNVIETKALTKVYGGQTAVDALELRVPEGCVYGFIGPNGAGKTTTLKMLLGLAHPTRGSVCLLGREMNEKNRLELLRQTGSLIELPSCYAHLTARENLQILAQLKGVSEREIDRALEMVELEGEARRRVGEFSLGMRQRLGIAQALLGQPRLLILDEPTNGLDPEGIRSMRAMIRALPEAWGATVVLSSHLLGELEQMADHVGILDKGHLLWQGPLDRLMAERGGEVVVTRRARTLEEIFLDLVHEREEAEKPC